MTLEARHVGVELDDRWVVRDESVVCRPGEMTALVGPSGSGKTTLLHCLGLLQAPSSGDVLVDGESTAGWRDGRRRRLWRDRTAFVLQDYGVMLEESVHTNVTMRTRVWSRQASGDPGRLRAALEVTGLADRGDEQASHLSGGERQRLAIARAVYKDARLVLVDEPTASLDATNRDLVIELFRERARQGCTLVIATHDPAVVDACHAVHRVGTASALEAVPA
ncbi:ABC transporter ATP-binding protein [Microbacterium sp. ARD31]|uniref:ABC transporter ATP-binding protein n=1 Tax=Microbacterium sp. ARD31 TaxID=2962576 RepID=UPI00288124C1|nr:ABC transporter ATP-binding protein [Microbacterium sp. ARD31]MDT0188354.1 ABC transporter ATP-binding protein [Microbacterium sp. ARD31]